MNVNFLPRCQYDALIVEKLHQKQLLWFTMPGLSSDYAMICKLRYVDNVSKDISTVD